MVAITPEVVTGAVLFVLALLGELQTRFARKRVERLRQKRRTTKVAHESIPHVAEGVGRIEKKVDNLDEKVDDLHHTVAYFHRDQLTEDPLARERLDVEADDDFLRGGD